MKIGNINFYNNFYNKAGNQFKVQPVNRIEKDTNIRREQQEIKNNFKRIFEQEQKKHK